MNSDMRTQVAPTARSEGPEMRVWTPERLGRFLDAIVGNRNEALFRLMAMTGLRRSEAAGFGGQMSITILRLTHASVSFTLDNLRPRDARPTSRRRRSRRCAIEEHMSQKLNRPRAASSSSEAEDCWFNASEGGLHD